MDLDAYIETRCEKALLTNKEYVRIQMLSDNALKNNDMDKYNEYIMSMLVLTESICYKLALKDIAHILTR